MPHLKQTELDADDRRHVVGVTSLGDNRVYVLREPSKQTIEVYDTKSFQLQQTLNVSGLSDHLYNGLAACVNNSCLYVNDYYKCVVFNIQLPGDNEVSQWEVAIEHLDVKPVGISVNSARNLLVTCFSFSANKLLEYTPRGLLVREISLQLGDNKLSPWHAVQLSDNCNRFVVCISRSRGSSYDDVVEVNSKGQVVVRYKDHLQSTDQRQFDWPRHLAVDTRNERIYVADCVNDRIVMLSRSSKSAFKLQTSIEGYAMNRPHCLHLEESRNRLYVGDFDGRIFV
jgi:DNA-binding beta-propeller fold protein YncE